MSDDMMGHDEKADAICDTALKDAQADQAQDVAGLEETSLAQEEKAQDTPTPLGDGKAPQGLPDESLTAGQPDGTKDSQALEVLAVKLGDQIIERLSSELRNATSEMMELRKSFDGKLKYDAKKDDIIDRQHKELEGFKSGVADKLANQIVMDLIFEIDSTEKLLAHYQDAEFSEENYKKMLKIFKNFSLSLCDILEKHGVQSYRSEAGGSFDPKRQRALKQTETGDDTLAKTVKAILRPGFERLTGVVRPEMVDVYVFKPSAEPVPEQAAPAEPQSQPAPSQEAEGQETTKEQEG